MKKIALSMLFVLALAFTFTGCGGVGNSDQAQDQNQTQGQDQGQDQNQSQSQTIIIQVGDESVVCIDGVCPENNSTNFLEFDLNLSMIPSYTYDYTGGVLPVTMTAIRDRDLDLSETTIFFKHQINDRFTSGTYGAVYYNVLYDVYTVEGTVYIPYNDTEEVVNHFVTAVYMLDGDNVEIQKFHIEQLANTPTPIVDVNVTASIDFTFGGDPDSNVTIITDQNGVSYLANSNVTITATPEVAINVE